jgi:hypothetical protein
MELMGILPWTFVHMNFEGVDVQLHGSGLRRSGLLNIAALDLDSG